MGEVFVDVDELVKLDVDDVVKRKPMPKWWLWVLLGVLLVVFFVFVFSVPSTNPALVSIDELEQSEGISATLMRQYQPSRVDYGLGEFNGKSFSIVDFFSDLPSVPSDFWRVKYLIMSGRASADMLCGLSEEYFWQPEFFGNSWVDVGLNIYRSPDPNHWTPEGYGTFPHVIEALSFNGSSFVGCTFFHSSYGVETFQGFRLVPVFPEFFEYAGERVSVNASLSREYLSLVLDEPDVLLSPAYLRFQPNWSQKVRFRVSVSPDAPSGLYAVGWDVSRADIRMASEWKGLYGELYQSISGVRVSEPQFVMVVRVE